MNSRNTLDKKSYLILTLLSGVSAGIWYFNLYFRPLSWCTLNQSRLIISLIFGLVMGVYLFLTMDKERTVISLVTTAVLPYGIYTCMSYMDKESISVLVCIIATVILVLINLGLVIANRLIHKETLEETLWKSAKDVLYLLRNWGSAASVVFMIFLSVQAMKDDGVVPAVQPDVPSTAVTTEHKAQEYLDKLVNFSEGRWENLSEEERIALCALVAQIETKSLGMTMTAGIIVKDLDENIAGTYSHQNRLISIDREYLMRASGMKLINVVCHEVRHQYQHEIVDFYDNLEDSKKDLAIFDEIRYIKENYENYITYQDDADGYANQYIEGDAREYARMCVNFYEDVIYYYIDSLQEETSEWEE